MIILTSEVFIMHSLSTHFILFSLLTLYFSLFEVAHATDQPSFECPEIPLVSVAANLDIHIPLATYQSITGISNIWADFKFKGIDKDNDYIWRLHDYGTYLTPCTALNPALVSTKLDIHISSADYQSLEDGLTIWTSLKFKGIDADGYYIWRLQEYGLNKTEAASQTVQALIDTINAAELTLFAIQSNADNDTVMYLLKSTKAAAKTINSTVLLSDRDKTLARVGDARSAYIKDKIETAEALMIEVVERFIILKEKFHNL